jgi:hypothetical protein
MFQSYLHHLRANFQRYEIQSVHIIYRGMRYYLQGKGKAVPLQAWSGPEGSRKLGFPDYMTTA